jgi:hypothetical protein
VEEEELIDTDWSRRVAVLEIRVTHMLDEGHDEGSICTCPRRRDPDIPNFLKDVVKDIE